MKRLRCLKCTHRWTPRTEAKPLQCPQCKIPSWDNVDYRHCEVCERMFLVLYIHHKDGNRKNNKKENLIKVCNFCHVSIHNGLREKDRQGKDGKTIKSRIRKYSNSLLIRREINELRHFWLKHKKKDKEAKQNDKR